MKQNLQKLLEKASVSLLLESYDAIFSDFDPRPYTERQISDDFLLEAKKAVRESKTSVYELRFLIPKRLKNNHEEEVIKRRLHNYFRMNEALVKSEAKNTLRNGLLMTLFGMILMFFSTMIFHYESDWVIYDFLRIILEPAGWFLAWYGMDEIFYRARTQKPDLDFYKKIVHAKIYFGVY